MSTADARSHTPDARAAGGRRGRPSLLAPGRVPAQRVERLAPPKVAWVAEIPVPYRVGLYRRIREEAGIDLKLFFCASSQRDRDWDVDLEGVPHAVLPGITLPVRPREQFFLRLNPQIGRELRRFAPDAVVVGGYAHLTMQQAMLWCRWTGTPYLINSETHRRSADARSTRFAGTHTRDPSPAAWVPGTGLSLPASSLRVPAKRVDLASAVKRFFVRGAAAGLPAGSLAREYLLSCGARPDRMFLLPNTCDVDRFAEASRRTQGERPALRAQLGLGSGPVALYVGRLTPAKGLDTLLRAFALVRPQLQDPRPQLLLVGDGEQRVGLESMAVELQLQDAVRFAGSRPWAQLPRLYGLADLFVLPSRFEPWGAVVNEAQACGLPVILTDQVGCAPDLVSPGENGWIVPAGHPAKLADALAQALSDETRLSSMGAASARRVRAWSEDACLLSFARAVEAVMGRR